jgi:hypothetical protein
MDKSTLLLLEKLATKLGTTTEYLWGILIKQAPVSATKHLLFFIITTIVGVLLFFLHKRLMKEDEYEDTVYDDLEVKATAPMIIGAIIWAIFFITSLILLEDVITGFINPEYWALNKILNIL